MAAATIDPTPREIRQRAAEVRTAWSRRERWKRAGKPPRVTCQMVRAGEIVAAIQDEYQEQGDQ